MGDASILYQQEQQKDLATAKKNDDRNPAGTGIAVPTDGNVTRRLRIDASTQNRASDENPQAGTGDQGGKPASNADRVKAQPVPTDGNVARALRIDASPQNRASDENPQAGTGDQGGKPASNADHMRHERFEPRSEFERKMQTQEAKASWSPIFDPNFSRAIGYQRQSYGFSEVHDVSGNFVGTSQAFEGQNPDFAKLKGELARRNLPEPRTDYERDLQQGKYGRAWEPVFAQNIKDSPIGYQFSSATITYFDISGRFVGSSSGEKPLEPPALDPIDFVPTEAIGTLAAKGGTFIFKEMAQAVGRAIGKEGVEEAEKIGFSAAMKSASEKLGTFGKALVEDEAGAFHLFGAAETKLSQAEYEAALKMVFPSQYADGVAKLVDNIGQGAAKRAMDNPRFVQAMQDGNTTLAGTLFHSAAAEEARSIPAAILPKGWTLEAEKTIQSGAGGSRADILLRGPGADVVEFDWKTTGRSALSSGSRNEMARHAGQITVNIGGKLTTQQSRSWMDYVRPLL